MKDLNEEMLQEILLEYAKRNNTSNAVTEKNAEAPSAKQKQEAPKESNDAADSTPSGTDAHNETVSSESDSDENNDEGENADEIKPFKMDQSPWDN